MPHTPEEAATDAQHRVDAENEQGMQREPGRKGSTGLWVRRDPTQAEIRERVVEIQSEWTEADREDRAVIKRPEWMLPTVEMKQTLGSVEHC